MPQKHIFPNLNFKEFVKMAVYNRPTDNTWVTAPADIKQF